MEFFNLYSIFLWLALTGIALSHHVPAPYPPDTETLHLKYGGTWITPGMHLSIDATAEMPFISSRNLECGRNYIVFFIDIDVILPNGAATTVLHWYQPGMRADCDRFALVNQTSDGAHYVGPRPPPGPRHRYVYYVYEQPDGYVFPDCFGYIFPGTVDARAGFDLRQFNEVAGLGSLVAANHLLVGNPERATTTLVATTTSLRSAPCSEETEDSDWMSLVR